MTYIALLAVPFSMCSCSNPSGTQDKAVGQNPHAAESVGINVNRIKFYALLLSGLFGAFGGLYLSMGYVS